MTPQAQSYSPPVQSLPKGRYRCGQLHFIDIKEQSAPSANGSLNPNWIHRIDMILHPLRGALLMHRCPAGSSASGQYIAAGHARLVALQKKIRRRLDEDAYWRRRAIALGIGLVVDEGYEDIKISPPILPQLIVDGAEVEALPRQLDRLFAFYATPANSPVASYGDELITALTESSTMGHFVEKPLPVAAKGHRYADFSSDCEAA